MITDLETLLNATQFNELVKAINENRDFSFCQDGLQLTSKSTDNGLQIVLSYDSTQNQKKQAEKERKQFLEFVDSIDGNLFVELIETMEQPLVNKLQDMVNSDDLESVRAAVVKFKSEYKQLLNNKIKYYHECLSKLDK